jgi:hypothetical protein
VLDCVERTESHLLGITAGISSSNCSITTDMQSTLEASGIQLPALRNHIPCMVHSIQLALSPFMGSLGVKGHTKSSYAQERREESDQNKASTSRRVNEFKMSPMLESIT